jgi:hypothetical protein
MKRAFSRAWWIGPCAAFLLAVPGAARAAGPVGRLMGYLSAAGRVPPGKPFDVHALIVNRGEDAVTAAYGLKADGATVTGNAVERRIWLAAGAVLPVRFAVRPEKAGQVTLTLLLDGNAVAEQSARAAEPAPAPVSTRFHALADGPLTVPCPKKGAGGRFEIEVTLGVPGELAATLAGLRDVAGLDADAILARDIVPAALEGKDVPALALLYALQRPSGGWGADPLALADVRTTSWVAFWLGHLEALGTKPAPKVRAAALGFLRKRLKSADPAMQARILSALKANGNVTKAERALLGEKGAGALSGVGRLFALYAGADVPPPAPAALKKRAVMAAALQVLTRLDQGVAHATDVAALARARGAAPGYDAHAAPLCALAFRKLADVLDHSAGGAVTVSYDGPPGRTKTLKLEAPHPVARCAMEVPAPPGGAGPVPVRIDGPRDRGLFCRVLVRPLKR